MDKNRKAIWKRLWRLLPALLLMGLIFHFSAEDATASAQSSGNTMLWLLRLFHVSDTDAIVENSELYSLLDFCIRKGAHFSLYTALGFFLAFAWTAHPSIPQWKRTTYAILCGIFYAASDELHQYYAPGTGKKRTAPRGCTEKPASMALGRRSSRVSSYFSAAVHSIADLTWI